MAEDIAFNLDINSNGGAKSLADLKKEFKELQTELSKTKEGTKEYQAALQKLGAVKDDIGDLRDTISALNPEGKIAAFAKVGSTIASGFAAAQGAAALFGTESKELEKTMLKVQAAMALAEGIKGITAAGDAFKVLNVVMKANPILAIVAGFTALAAIAYTVYENFVKQASAIENLEKQHQKLVESTAKLNKEYELQIKNLSGLKSTEDDRLKITEKQIQGNILIAKSTLQIALAKQAQEEAESSLEETIVRATGNTIAADKIREDRVKKSREDTEKAIFDLKAQFVELNAFRNVQEQKKLDKELELNKKSTEDAEKAAKEKAAIEKKYLEDSIARQKAAQDEIDKYIHDSNVNARKRLEEKQEENVYFGDEETNTFLGIAEKKKKKKEEDAAKEVELEKQIADEKQQIIGKSLQAATALSDLYFAHQLRQAKGNTEREKELKKKQFNLNKAFSITGAVIDGIRSVQAALTMPPPLSYVLAALNGILAGAAIAKIASTKFDDGGSSASAGDVGGLTATASAPAIQTPNNSVTKISDTGKVENVNTKPQDQRVYIVETDIDKSQKRIANIEETAKIG